MNTTFTPNTLYIQITHISWVLVAQMFRFVTLHIAASTTALLIQSWPQESSWRDLINYLL